MDAAALKDAIVLQTVGAALCFPAVLWIGVWQAMADPVIVSQILGESPMGASAFSIGMMLNALPLFSSERTLFAEHKNGAFFANIARYMDMFLLVAWLVVQQYTGAPAGVDGAHRWLLVAWVATQYGVGIYGWKLGGVDVFLAKLVLVTPIILVGLYANYASDSTDAVIVSEIVTLTVYLLCNIAAHLELLWRHTSTLQPQNGTVWVIVNENKPFVF